MLEAVVIATVMIVVALCLCVLMVTEARTADAERRSARPRRRPYLERLEGRMTPSEGLGRRYRFSDGYVDGQWVRTMRCVECGRAMSSPVISNGPDWPGRRMAQIDKTLEMVMYRHDCEESR